MYAVDRACKLHFFVKYCLHYTIDTLTHSYKDRHQSISFTNTLNSVLPNYPLTQHVYLCMVGVDKSIYSYNATYHTKYTLEGIIHFKKRYYNCNRLFEKYKIAWEY